MPLSLDPYFLPQQFLYNLWYLTFSLLGNINYFFFAAHLLDVAVSIPSLKTILQSVTHNGKQVIFTCLCVDILTDGSGDVNYFFTGKCNKKWHSFVYKFVKKKNPLKIQYSLFSSHCSSSSPACCWRLSCTATLSSPSTSSGNSTCQKRMMLSTRSATTCWRSVKDPGYEGKKYSKKSRLRGKWRQKCSKNFRLREKWKEKI